MLGTTAVLALMETKGIGRKTIARLWQLEIAESAGPHDMHDLLSNLKETYPHTPLPGLPALQRGLDRAERVLEACATNHIGVVTPADTSFPNHLHHIPDPPPLLFYRGRLSSCTERPVVAIVGTRSPSNYGLSCSRRLGRVFAQHGFTVVSGLALGCDVAAHRGCLDAGGTTSAILAHGLNSIHPRQHRRIADRLLAEGGCLLSEYAPGTPPHRNHFVMRNRLQSGLSEGTVVVETGLSGGTMHTARFALEQGRVLGCLTHQLRQQGDYIAGNELLLQEDSALPLGSKEEIERFMESMLKSATQMPTHNPYVATKTPASPKSIVSAQLSLF